MKHVNPIGFEIDLLDQRISNREVLVSGKDIREDMWALFDAHPGVASIIRGHAEAGKIDGTTYGSTIDDCACFKGIAAQKSTYVIDRGRLSPMEIWCRNIHRGQTPANSPHSALTIEMIDLWSKSRHCRL